MGLIVIPPRTRSTVSFTQPHSHNLVKRANKIMSKDDPGHFSAAAWQQGWAHSSWGRRPERADSHGAIGDVVAWRLRVSIRRQDIQ